MLRAKLGLAAAMAFATSAAQAGTIEIKTFSTSEYNTLTGGGNWVIEDFENTPQTLSVNGSKIDQPGELAGPLTSSLVGTFSSTGGTGSGSTCGSNGGDCTNLALVEGTINGQGNLVPDNGVWSLSSNDTLGVNWDVELDGGQEFNQVVFAIEDPSDNGALVTVSAAGETVIDAFEGANNNDSFIVRVLFDSPVDAASITLANSKRNDAFSIDGAAVAAVPLPAAAWLFGSALLGMAGIGHRRRRKV